MLDARSCCIYIEIYIEIYIDRTNLGYEVFSISRGSRFVAAWKHGPTGPKRRKFGFEQTSIIHVYSPRSDTSIVKVRFTER